MQKRACIAPVAIWGKVLMPLGAHNDVQPRQVGLGCTRAFASLHSSAVGFVRCDCTATPRKWLKDRCSENRRNTERRIYLQATHHIHTAADRPLDTYTQSSILALKQEVRLRTTLNNRINKEPFLGLFFLAVCVPATASASALS